MEFLKYINVIFASWRLNLVVHEFQNYSYNFEFQEKQLFFLAKPHYNLMRDLLICDL